VVSCVKCLILGGSGFLGCHLARELVEIGHCVTIYDQVGFSEKAPTGNKKIEFIEGNFDEIEKLNRVLETTEVVYHLVSTTKPWSSNSNVRYDIESNIVATIGFLDAAIKNKIKKVIFFSSGGTVYGNTVFSPIDENHPTNPICAYGIHKLTIEKYLFLYSYLHGLKSTVLRISNPYGPNQVTTDGQGVIPEFIKAALQRKPISIWGDGSAERDYIYVTDVVEAAAKFIDYDGDEVVFNISSGISTSLLTIVGELESIIGETLEVQFSEPRKMDVTKNCLSNKKVLDEIGWKPTTGLKEGLSLTLDFWRNAK